MKNKIIILFSILAVISAGVIVYFGLVKNRQPKEQLSAVLNVYNWEDYFGTSTIEDFEKEFGVKVNLEVYNNEDTMLSGVQSDPRKYDIVVGSDILVKEMINMKLLAQIDKANIPNFKNIGSEFKNPVYDPNNEHSIPYMWGTSGIAINRKYIKEEPSWAILWNPAYKGKIAMLDNMQDVIGAALKYAGYSANSVDPEELAKAEGLLIKQKPLVAIYQGDEATKDDLISEKIWAGHTYSGSGNSIAQENENVEYSVPKEGGFIWTDNLLIPVGAQHKYTAEVFINYILRPDVSAKIANYLWYANANEAAKKFTNPEILQNSNVYPPEEVRKKLEFSGYFGGVEAVALYNKIWAELQATK